MAEYRIARESDGTYRIVKLSGLRTVTVVRPTYRAMKRAHCRDVDDILELDGGTYDVRYAPDLEER